MPIATTHKQVFDSKRRDPQPGLPGQTKALRGHNFAKATRADLVHTLDSEDVISYPVCLATQKHYERSNEGGLTSSMMASSSSATTATRFTGMPCPNHKPQTNTHTSHRTHRRTNDEVYHSIRARANVSHQGSVVISPFPLRASPHLLPQFLRGKSGVAVLTFPLQNLVSNHH